MYLYIARHGESNGNIGVDKTLDPFLSSRGEEQVALLGERLSGIRFDRIFASTLTRSIQTAAAVAMRQPGGPAPVEILADLVECGTTPGWRGKSKGELMSVYPHLVFCPDSAPGDGKPWVGEADDAEHLARAYRVVSYMKKRFGAHSDAKILIAAHGGFNQKLLAAAMSWGNIAGAIYSQNNACLNLVEYFADRDGSHKARLTYTNNVTHLLTIGSSDK